MVDNAPGHSKPERTEDEIFDELERKMYSGKRAYIYTAGVILTTLLAGLIIGIAGAIVGGPTCDAGKSSFICSRTWEILFPVAPGVISMVGCLLGFWQTYVEWKNFRNWRPWLAMCWVLMPFTLMWMLSTFGVLILGVK